MIKTIASIAAAATLAIGSAVPAFAQSNHAAHVELARATERTGVSVLVNPEVCGPEFNEGYLGLYSGERRVIVICQENGRYDGVEGNWTEEEYDTLRHEIQHRIQDCMINGISDHTLGPVYQNPVGLALNVLGEDVADRIVEVYAFQGADEDVIILELEAFAVAALNDPADQIADLDKYCAR